MIAKTTEDLKREIALRAPRRAYFLYGDEQVMLQTFHQKLCKWLTADGTAPDVLRGSPLDVGAFAEVSGLVSFFGGRRLLAVPDLDVESLTNDEEKLLCETIRALPEETTVLLTATPRPNDAKKPSKHQKALIAAVDAVGLVCACNAKTNQDLHRYLVAYCQKQRTVLSLELARFLVDYIGGDMGLLVHECDKLCAYADGGEITRESILLLAIGNPTTKLYQTAAPILAGNPVEALRQLHTLLGMREDPSRILSNITHAFADYARANAARTAGKNAGELQKDFSYRFDWQVRNNLRDAGGIPADRLLAACEVFSLAEARMRSTAMDSRTLLETAVLEAMLALRGEGC